MSKSNGESVRTLLAVPDSFRATALAFPDKVQRALALVETAEEAAELLNKAEVMAQFARRVRADTETINAVQFGKLLIVAKLGELLGSPTPAERGAMGGRGKKSDGNGKASAPGALAIGKRTQTEYRKVAKSAPKIEEYRAKVEANNAEQAADSPEIMEVSTAGFLRFVSGGIAGSLVASEENEWYTPKKYIDAAKAVLERIDLDPASSTAANAIIKAKKFYTADDDSLNKPWEGRIWLNPPYGRLAGDFARKLLSEYQEGNTKAAIILINAHCTDTDWFQGLWDYLLCFTDHRIDFDSAGREKLTSSTHGSVFVYLGRRNSAFIKEFAAFGAVVRRA